VGAFISVKDAGGIAAVQTLVNTINVAVLGIVNFIMPYARRIYLNEGISQWDKLLKQVTYGLVLFCGIFISLIIIFSDNLLGTIYSVNFIKYSHIVPVLGASSFISAINSMYSVRFRTMERPQIGFYAKVLSTIGVLLFSYPLLRYFGLIGAAIGILITQIIWFVFYLIVARKFHEGIIKHKLKLG
jgi:O-antigen/teichoic acid export membrane protein